MELMQLKVWFCEFCYTGTLMHFKHCRKCGAERSQFSFWPEDMAPRAVVSSGNVCMTATAACPNNCGGRNFLWRSACTKCKYDLVAHLLRALDHAEANGCVYEDDYLHTLAMADLHIEPVNEFGNNWLTNAAGNIWHDGETIDDDWGCRLLRLSDVGLLYSHRDGLISVSEMERIATNET